MVTLSTHYITKGRVATFFCLMVSLALSALAAGPATLPTFSLPDAEGKMISSAQFAGKVLVIDFWATWCATCKETVPRLSALQEKHKAKGLVVIGISVDKGSDEKIRKSAKKLGVNYLVLRDKENSLASAFGFSGIPSLYVFDRKGQLKLGLPGYDHDQEKQLDEAAEAALR